MGLKIEVGKQYVTRDGHRVRIYATDGGGTYPIHGAIFFESEGWCASTWGADGRYKIGLSEDDLVAEYDPKKETQQ